MTQICSDYSIVIVGAGPAGSAAAIRIANRSPELASRILLLDRATFPRTKLCGGGVTVRSDRFLEELDVQIDVPFVPVDAMRFVLNDRTVLKNRQEQFRVVAREDFDDKLFRCAQSRGVHTVEGEYIVALERSAEGVQVTTNRTTYRADAVIGADGANSAVRRLTGLKRRAACPVVFEVLVPVDPAQTEEFIQRTAVIDVSTVAAANGGGYCWSFPSYRQSSAKLNLGSAYFNPRQDVAQGAETKRIFMRWLEDRGLDLANYDLKGHPLPIFHPHTESSSHRVVLAGDAVGVEPLMGEGISSALGLGIIAADAVLAAVDRDDFSFADYRSSILRSPIGLSLRSKRVWARSFYRDPSYFLVAAMSHFALQRRTKGMPADPASGKAIRP